MITKEEIQALLQSTETYRMERTVSTGNIECIERVDDECLYAS